MPAGHAFSLPLLSVSLMCWVSVSVRPSIRKAWIALPGPSEAHARRPSGENAMPT